MDRTVCSRKLVPARLHMAAQRAAGSMVAHEEPRKGTDLALGSLCCVFDWKCKVPVLTNINTNGL